MIIDDRILKKIEEALALKHLRRQHPYVVDIVSVLLPHEDGVSRQKVLEELDGKGTVVGLDSRVPMYLTTYDSRAILGRELGS